MKLYIKYNFHTACKKILQEQLDKLQLKYSLTSFNELELNETISVVKLNDIRSLLNNYGIEIITTHKNLLAQKIKDAIIEMVYMDDKLPTFKNSSYLTEKLKHSYSYISNLFSEVTYTSIENFIILNKIERAKELIIINELTISEIAWKLNYSSIAHLSNQFKSVTGLTPTTFQRIINKRHEAIDNTINHL